MEACCVCAKEVRSQVILLSTLVTTQPLQVPQQSEMLIVCVTHKTILNLHQPSVMPVCSHRALSTYFNLHQPSVMPVCSHRALSTYFNLHQPSVMPVCSHRALSTCFNLHQPSVMPVCSHRALSTCFNLHQPSVMPLCSHRAILSTCLHCDMYPHGLLSTNFNCLNAVLCSSVMQD